ncbi:hypothetical protein FXO37_33358 [Capsicum annuum]|nr:hypothetical protein FXO37_33358 [Capsicum annuum]
MPRSILYLEDVRDEGPRRRAYEAKDVIDSIIVRDNGLLHLIFSLPITIKKIKHIKEEVSNISERIPKNRSLTVVKSTKKPVENKSLAACKITIGFEEAANWLIRKLTSGPKDLDVISITGMPSSGKTTLEYKIRRELGLEKREFGEEICLDELLDVGKEIVQNCKGLPLVVDLIAGVIADEPILIAEDSNLENLRSSGKLDDPDGVQDKCAVCFSRLLSTHVHHSLTSLVLSPDLDMMIRQSYKLQWLSANSFLESTQKHRGTKQLYQNFHQVIKDVINVLDLMERLKNEEGQNVVNVADQIEKLKLHLAFICTYVQLSHCDLEKFEDEMCDSRQRIDNLLQQILDDVDNNVRCKYNMDRVLPSLMDNIDECINSCHRSKSSAMQTDDQLNFLLKNLHHLSMHLDERIFPLVTQYEILQKVCGNIRDFHGLILNGYVEHEIVEFVL